MTLGHLKKLSTKSRYIIKEEVNEMLENRIRRNQHHHGQHL
jgi:hypothetical protein